jgi:hypothetical protein
MQHHQVKIVEAEEAEVGEEEEVEVVEEEEEDVDAQMDHDAFYIVGRMAEEATMVNNVIHQQMAIKLTPLSVIKWVVIHIIAQQNDNLGGIVR